MDASAAAGLELQLTLLHSSLTGGRLGTLTDPFPQAFEAVAGETVSTECRDFDALLSTVASLPPAAAVIDRHTQLTVQQREVVSWLEGLARVRPTAVDTDAMASATTPSHQFSVQDHRSVPRRERWAELAEMHGIAKVYHGSAVENFHSILNNGNYARFLGFRCPYCCYHCTFACVSERCWFLLINAQASKTTPERSGSELAPRLATGSTCQIRCSWLKILRQSSRHRVECGLERATAAKSAASPFVKWCCTLMCGAHVATRARPLRIKVDGVKTRLCLKSTGLLRMRSMCAW